MIAAGIGVLYLVLYRVIEPGSILRFVPYFMLALFAAAPFVAAWLSGRTAPLGAAAGGLALGIAATVGAAAAARVGSGAMPLALGVAVAGTISLKDAEWAIWARLIAVVLLAVYAWFSDRLVGAIFAYPLLGLADEFADAFASWRSRGRKAAATS